MKISSVSTEKQKDTQVFFFVFYIIIAAIQNSYSSAIKKYITASRKGIYMSWSVLSRVQFYFPFFQTHYRTVFIIRFVSEETKQKGRL